MSEPRATLFRRWAVGTTLMVAGLFVGCGREVSVATDAGTPPPSDGGAGTGGAPTDGPRTDLIGGIEQQDPPDGGTTTGGTGGIVSTGGTGGTSTGGTGGTSTGGTGGTGTGGTGGTSTGGTGGTTTGGTGGTSTGGTGGTSTGGTGGTSTGGTGGTTTGGTGGTSTGNLITGLQVLVDGLNAIHVPSVGTERVSLLQYTSTGAATVLHVTWTGSVGYWHSAASAYHIYTAASGTRHVNLLYDHMTYPIYENGGAIELSGTQSTYKEFLTASSQGFAWVDYGTVTSGGTGSGPGGPGGIPTGTATLGKITYKRWDGTRVELTDGLRYRARVALSETHIAYVEYASTVTGTPGQIIVQPLSGGAAFAAAPSAVHQDRPAIAGDWVVWEEYVGGTDAVIRARHLVSGEVRDLSARVGFRTNPDIRGTRVIWEDQRSGTGDIYAYDFAWTSGERVTVSGVGHSTGARLTHDGLVWIEVNGNNMGILRARWTQ